MAYNKDLAERVRNILSGIGSVEEKKMFGGLSFMVNGYMCCGVLKNNLVVKVSEEEYVAGLECPEAREMDFTGRPMKGFLYIADEGDLILKKWIDKAVAKAVSG